MAQIQVINDGQDALVVRNNLNNNFANLNLEVLQREGITGLSTNSSIDLPNDALTMYVVVRANAGSTVKVDDPDANNVIPETTLTTDQVLTATWVKGYVTAPTFSIEVTGDVDIYVLFQNKFFSR